MSIELILQKDLVADENIPQVTRHEVKYEQAKSDQFTIPDVAISLTPLALLISWIVFFLILRKNQTSVDNKRIFIINSLHKVPCKNCKYYSNNHYVKCAVQPSIVMTEEAKNCSEYSAHKSKFSPRNMFDRDENS
ncbi:hypothetical protein BV372_10200 [Nostoc sp. T09]|uniref:hypothetical protein n=1 Tax=Nostoc sp. T09 TaxID=1932621 RepID=UPI000A38EDDA|nr:hypothetical protein [Nostoc sp. T09]OUL35662.1 hypothetical protein BV372_10200 [Nostoc sp. T09]